MPRKADFLPDTNVLLRYLLKDDPEQFSRAEEFFERIREGKERAILLEGVLVECLYVLTKHLPGFAGSGCAGIGRSLAL